MRFLNKISFTVVGILGMLSFLTLLLTSCPKDPWYNKKYIDKETKDYCLFGQNSYWLYEDSITLVTEKVVIDNPIEREFQFYRSGGDGGYRGETFSTMISLYFQDSKSSVDLTLGRIDFEVDCLFIKDDGTSLEQFYNHPFYHNGGKGKYTWKAVPFLFEKKDEYTLNGITFNSIKIFGFNYQEEKYIYYWAKHIGLIRIEVYEKENLASVKNLIEYNVKPYKQ